MDVAINSVSENGEKAATSKPTNETSTTEPRPIGSYPDTGIEIIIVGTGLAGLTAALECTRKGHKVRVLERNPDINVAGEPTQQHVSSRYEPC